MIKFIFKAFCDERHLTSYSIWHNLYNSWQLYRAQMPVRTQDYTGIQ